MSLKCVLCGLKVGSRTELGRHKVMAHQIHKPHLCNYCGKRFSGKTNLVMHVRLHTGEKPYACSVCGKDYADYSNCVKHIKTQHDGAASLIRRKFCDSCLQHFNSREEYFNHTCCGDTHGRPFSDLCLEKDETEDADMDGKDVLDASAFLSNLQYSLGNAGVVGSSPSCNHHSQSHAGSYLIQVSKGASSSSSLVDYRGDDVQSALPNQTDAKNSTSVALDPIAISPSASYTTKNPNKFLLARPSSHHGIASPGTPALSSDTSDVRVKFESAESPMDDLSLSHQIQGFDVDPSSQSFFEASEAANALYLGESFSATSPSSSTTENIGSTVATDDVPTTSRDSLSLAFRQQQRAKEIWRSCAANNNPCCDFDRKLRELETYMNNKFTHLAQSMQAIDRKLDSILSAQLSPTNNGNETWHFTIEKRRNS